MTTCTPDKYYEIINEFVLKLNYDWFLKKETKFRKEFYYKVDKGRIYHIDFQRIPNYDYDSETGEEILLGYEEIQNIIDIDLRSYCSCYLPIDEITDWGTWKYYDDDNRSASSNNIDENANGLVNEIAQFTAGLNDVVAISDFVSKTIYSIDEKINRLKEASHGNDIYAIVLADFLNAC